MRHHRTLAIPALLATCLLAGCAIQDTAGQLDSAGADTAAARGVARTRPAPALAGSIDGMLTPESVRYDPEQDIYFISNINGNPSQADGNGFIARVHPDSLTTPDLSFIRGGANGVTLNAPKGMAITGDTLWVTDISVVRGFDRNTGRSLATIDLRAQNPRFLNDIAAAPDGALYVTDTGIRFNAAGEMDHPGPDRVFRIAGRTVSVALEGDTLGRPNGIAWDAANNRFVLAAFGSPSIFTWAPGAATAAPLASGPGGHDGAEVLTDGRVLVTSWTDSTVYAIDSGASLVPLITGVASPADIGVDTRRNLVLIPLLAANRVVIYEIP